MYAIRGEDVTEELHRACEEGALARFGVEPLLLEFREDSSQVDRVLRYGLRIDDDVIHEDHHEVLFDHGFEDVVHEAHEGGWCIAETHRHDGVLVEATRRSEGGLLPISFGQGNLIEP